MQPEGKDVLAWTLGTILACPTSNLAPATPPKMWSTGAGQGNSLDGIREDSSFLLCETCWSI